MLPAYGIHFATAIQFISICFSFTLLVGELNVQCWNLYVNLIVLIAAAAVAVMVAAIAFDPHS